VTLQRNDRLVRANGVDLCAETFGDRADAPILLIMGSSASMDWWEDEFCERLAAGSRFVIRYDHRDTGRSITYPPGAPQYTMRDLVTDAVCLLDAFDLAVAHLAGMSMGGGIAQLVALDHPGRVASLTLISTSLAEPDEPDLPAMPEEAVARFPADEPDWSDRTAVIDHMVQLARASAGKERSFDEAAFRDLAGRVVDRTTNIASTMINHAVMEGGDRWRERLGELRMPTLVVHGTEDRILPFEATAKRLPDLVADLRLIAVEGGPHNIGWTHPDEANKALLEFLAEDSDREGLDRHLTAAARRTT
jgi:pimeloyl-ACP methyl ester carboxylesterase